MNDFKKPNSITLSGSKLASNQIA